MYIYISGWLIYVVLIYVLVIASAWLGNFQLGSCGCHLLLAAAAGG